MCDRFVLPISRFFRRCLAIGVMSWEKPIGIWSGLGRKEVGMNGKERGALELHLFT